MNLRRQLLLVSLLTLVLPWAGCQFIQETETALRDGQQQMLAGTTQAIAESLSQHAAEFAFDAASNGHLPADQIYGHPIAGVPLVDGYINDWSTDPSALRNLRGVDGDNRFIVAVSENYAWLFVEVRDKTLVYTPTGYEKIAAADRPAADQVELLSPGSEGERLRFLFAAEAPGPLPVWRVDGSNLSPETRIRAYWQDTAAGYQLEARIPLSLLGDRLGIAVYNTARPDRAAVRSANYGGPVPGHFITSSALLRELAASYVQPGQRLIITDHTGWRLAQAGSLGSNTALAQTEAAPGWLRLAYDALLEPGSEARLAEPDVSGREQQPYISAALSGRGSSNWFRSADTGRAIIAVARPVVHDGSVVGSVILQQSTGEILSLTNEALARLMSFTLLATILVALSLLGYATWLSLRIRRLSDAAELALERGTDVISLPSSNASDEIGDLSRSFSNVLRQLGSYNTYLRTLASKLSHEMRTPLTIVTSSLDNLEQEQQSQAAAAYTARARDGARRLQKILAAMSEANRIEELVEQLERESFDLDALLAAATAAYEDAYPERVFHYASPGHMLPYQGAPELLVQMLDKLIANAVDFSAAGERIDLDLRVGDDHVEINISNPGPPLPEHLAPRLFDSMVTVRGGDTAEHLGLGLYIARVICEGHGGTIRARNTDNGVCFTVRLPTTAGT
jgi:dedicated sortase system histidine kinase